MTTTPTSAADDMPEALRSIQRFEVVDCIDDKHVPAVIPKPRGPWVRYEDHIAALAAGQATAAPAQPADSVLEGAARYQWIRGPVEESTRYSRWRIEYWDGPNGWQPMQRERMDAAIDAAMNKGGAA